MKSVDWIISGGGLMAILGIFLLTPDTRGVGLICGACYLGIIARIVQAEGEKKR